MKRAFGAAKAVAGVTSFFAAWLAGHLFDGSAAFDGREFFNATVGLLAAATVHLVIEGRQAPLARWAALIATAVAPVALAYAQAQTFGTVIGVGRGVQWLAFACLGQGLGLLTAEGPEAPVRPRLQTAAFALAAGLAAFGVALWAQQSLPKWAPLGAGVFFFAVTASFFAPALGRGQRQALSLRGLLAPLGLGLALFLLDKSDPAGGRLFFTSLAFAAGWVEARLPSSSAAPSSDTAAA